MNNKTKQDVCEEWGQSVSFGIRSDQLMTEGVSRQLDLDMTDGFNTGSEVFVRRTGERHIRNWGVWQYDSRHFVQSEDIKDHLEFILNTFESRMDKLQPFLDDESYYVAIWIWFEGGIGVAGYGLYNETLSRIMKISKALNFTLSLATSPDSPEIF